VWAEDDDQRWLRWGYAQRQCFGAGEFGVGEHFRGRQVDRKVGRGNSQQQRQQQLSVSVFALDGMLVVCVANILLNYAWRWRWRWRWRWEPVLVLVSVTKTWTRRKCNWTWSGWKAIKGGTSTPGCPFLYVPDICKQNGKNEGSGGGTGNLHDMNAGNKSTDAAAFQLNGESQLLRVAVTQKCRGL